MILTFGKELRQLKCIVAWYGLKWCNCFAQHVEKWALSFFVIIVRIGDKKLFVQFWLWRLSQHFVGVSHVGMLWQMSAGENSFPTFCDSPASSAAVQWIEAARRVSPAGLKCIVAWITYTMFGDTNLSWSFDFKEFQGISLGFPMLWRSFPFHGSVITLQAAQHWFYK